MGMKSYLKRGIQYIRRGIPEYHTTVTVKTIQPTDLLKGRNIIITGGGRGLGYYIAKKSLAEGARVLITGRNENTLKQAALELGSNAKYLRFDVQDVRELRNFYIKRNNYLEEKRLIH